MNFVEKKSNRDIGIEDQNLEVEFAHAKIVNGRWTNQSYFSVCRDFMGDCIYATEINKPVEIYGFYYNPKENPLYKTKTAVAMKFPDRDVMETFEKNMYTHFPMDGIYNYKLTKDVKQNIIVVVLDKLWNKTTFGISYLTFVLKCMCYELTDQAFWLEQIENMTYNRKDHWSGEVETLPIKEAGYVKKIKKDLEKLPAVISRVLLEMQNSHGLKGVADTHRVHNNTGFYSSLLWKKTDAWDHFSKAIA